MMNPRMRHLAKIAVVGGGLCAWAGAQAADTTDIGTVQAAGAAGGTSAAAIGTAAFEAPSQTPLDVTQPTSIVSRNFVENSVVQTGNYDDAIKFTPSFSNVEPNGPGLQESKFINIRGFQDGQYNLTYDGIPLAGSPTSFHHESAVYFMEHDLGGVQLDRGPGTASTVGNATFGGTLNLLSKDSAPDAAFSPYSTFGSFNTTLEGAELDSGAIKALNNASFLFDLEHLNSDGFLTNSTSKRTNSYLKGLVPLGSDTVIAFVGMINHTEQHVPSGATLEEIAQYGYNFGLNTNPLSNNYTGYNTSTYDTDLEYLGLNSFFGDGWEVDNKLYTDFFAHNNNASTKNNDDLPADFTNLSTSYNLGGAMLTSAQIASGAYKAQVLGTVGKQDYRAIGDIFRLSKNVDFGQVRTGLWFDHTGNAYNQYSADWSAGGQSYVKCASTTLASCPAAGAFAYLLHDDATSVQAYLEADIKPFSGLTLTPGIKYSSYELSENATVNSSTKLPFAGSESWNAILPSITANYLFRPEWSAYAQVAKGFQAPPLNAFFAASPNAVAPETTWNYQIGTVWKSNRVTLSADLYYIDFGNFYSSYKDANANTVYVSAGSATYKGAELEGTVVLGYDVSLYANATLNRATYANGEWIANAPIGTGSLGLIYQDHNGWYGSLMSKFVGRQYGLDKIANGAAKPTLADQYALPNYAYADLAVSYDLKNDAHVLPLLSGAKIGFKVNNLFDGHSLIGYAGTDAAGPALYWVLPGRSYFATIELKF